MSIPLIIFFKKTPLKIKALFIAYAIFTIVIPISVTVKLAVPVLVIERVELSVVALIITVLEYGPLTVEEIEEIGVPFRFKVIL